MAKSSGFIELKPIPGGKYDQFLKSKTVKLPKDSNVFLYNLVDIYGSDEIRNMSEVGIGDYSIGKGTISALNVNVGRNIPRVEDGLKSVERRIIYVMFAKGYYGKKTAKVASIVGSMIEMVYPHGELAPAETIFRIGRHRSMMLPYVQELSNYGNMKDLKPAASRYADAALTKYAMDCFFGEVGPRSPLYDEQDTYAYQGKEPIFLTSRYPNILMQWNLGIGKGAMTWLGAFNSTDVFKAALTLMDDPDAKIDIYPDAPVPVDIINKSELKGCFDMTNFKVKMRSPYYTETDQRRVGTKVEDKHTIVFTALPLGVTGNQIASEIIKIKTDKKSKKFPEILNVEPIVDESSAGGIKVIIEYEHGYDPHVLAEKLYKTTSLAKTVGVKYNLVFEYHYDLRTPREILLYWITQRFDQKRRYYHQMVLKAAKDRAIYEGLSTILETADATDDAIKIIRSSKEDDESVEKLRKRFGLTDFQARVILEYKIKTLQRLNIEDVLRKRDEAIAEYKKYRKILASDTAIRDSIRDELTDGMKKYGTSRMAKLKNHKTTDIGDPEEKKYILYNTDFYYCFTDTAALQTIIPKIDNQYKLVEVKNTDNVMIFDKKGNIKILNGYSFNYSDIGIAMAALGVSDVVSILVDDNINGSDYIAMVTEQGYGKLLIRSDIAAAKGKVIALNSGDKLIAAIPVVKDYHPDAVLGMVQDDKMYYVKLIDLPVYKKNSAGNRIIKNVDDTSLTNAFVFDTSDNPEFLLIYGESGYIKLTDSQYLSFAKRGNNVITLGGKKIIGATLLDNIEGYANLYMNRADLCKMEVKFQIGKMVKFTIMDTGEEQKFRMSTSIGTPVKILRVAKNEWYRLE